MDNLTPETRLEKYLAKIAGQNIAIPNAETRFESYLAKIAGADIVTPEPKTKLEYYLNKIERKPEPEIDLTHALKFSSPNPFTLTTGNNRKNWNNLRDASKSKMEYCIDGKTWNEWGNSSTTAIETLTAMQVGNEYVLYLRGTGNTIVGYASTSATTNPGARFKFTGSQISCTGNIENLLDYTTVKNNEHPTMESGAFRYLFYETPIITAPELPASILTNYCYSYMFANCTSLTVVPTLSATTLSTACYMSMFSGCTALVAAPELLVTTLASYCYGYMFNGCTSLVSVPELPATTLSNTCYMRMFQNCTSLTTLPILPATTLANNCYEAMFKGCTQIKLSGTQTGDYQTAYRIPASDTGTTASNALAYMFTDTGGTFTGGTLQINTTYYTSNTLVPTTDL